jgi:hypothetical protein
VKEDIDSTLYSPGLDALITVLTDDLHRHSTKTVIYRLRCLAGAVRAAGRGVVEHQDSISKAIDFALSSDDRHLFKTGCKLLRHTLATLCESYAVAADMRPRAFAGDGSISLGKSAQLSGDAIRWHIPDAASIEFAWKLLQSHVSKRLDSLSSDAGEGRTVIFSSVESQELRNCLRVIRYGIRGGASMLDFTAEF